MNELVAALFYGRGVRPRQSEMPAEHGNCHIERLFEARKACNAGDIIGRKQPSTFANQRLKIVGIDTDGLAAFCRKIVVLSWISRQGNWMKTKTLGRSDVERTIPL